MASVFRYYENPPIHQVGDTKTSALFFDHAGWLLCDGRLLDKNEYNNLFNIIGTAFGMSGETHFAIPNPAGRVPAIIGQAAAGMNTWAMGDISGEEKHQLTIPEMPAHDHNGLTGLNGSHAHTIGDIPQGTQGSLAEIGGGTAADEVRYTGTTSTAPNHQHSISSQGNNLPHNNIQPTIYMGNMFIYGGF